MTLGGQNLGPQDSAKCKGHAEASGPMPVHIDPSKHHTVMVHILYQSFFVCFQIRFLYFPAVFQITERQSPAGNRLFWLSSTNGRHRQSLEGRRNKISGVLLPHCLFPAGQNCVFRAPIPPGKPFPHSSCQEMGASQRL